MVENNGYIKVGNHIIGDGHATFIVAEIGSNHNGDFEKAKEYIAAAKDIGADAVKFQAIHLEKFLASKIKKDGELVVNPARKNSKFISIPDGWYPELFNYGKELGVVAFATPFDIDSVDMLCSAGAEIMKIASGDITYLDLIRKVGETGKPVLLSTGMSNLGEIALALETLYSTGNKKVILLHCVSTYPTRYEDVNLRALLTVRSVFNTPVGLSDHTLGLETALGAVALGACVIEKHLTFSRTSYGTDHFFAMEFPEFKQMISSIRNLEIALGDGQKVASANEQARMANVRRGLYTSRKLNKGEIIKPGHIIAMRPQLDLFRPVLAKELIGLRAPCDLDEGTPLDWSLFCREL